MRLLYQSQFYFALSSAFHIVILIILIFGSVTMGRKIDSFEATVHFETPPQTSPAKNKNTSSSNPKGINANQPSVKPLSAKDLDELLENKKITVNPEENLENEISQIKSDLLGYLRATKKTKPKTKPNPATSQTTASQQSQKPVETPQKTQLDAPQGGENKEEPKTLEEIVENKPEEKAIEQSKPIPAVRRIWKRRNEIQSYRSLLNKYVSANWTLPPGKLAEFQIIIEVTIDKNGNVTKMQLIQSSGLPGIDASAERAIRVSMPFPKLPDSLGPNETEYKVRFRFTPKQVMN